MNIADIQTLDSKLPKFVPAIESYDGVSRRWVEAEYRAEVPAKGVVAGYWEGEEGWVDFESWPYNELCVILAGRVAVEDEAGGRIEYGAGESFLVPQGFSGRWCTLESTRKIFVGIESDIASLGTAD